MLELNLRKFSERNGLTCKEANGVLTIIAGDMILKNNKEILEILTPNISITIRGKKSEVGENYLKIDCERGYFKLIKSKAGGIKAIFKEGIA